jgi:hypothetical protein
VTEETLEEPRKDVPTMSRRFDPEETIWLQDSEALLTLPVVALAAASKATCAESPEGKSRQKEKRIARPAPRTFSRADAGDVQGLRSLLPPRSRQSRTL